MMGFGEQLDYLPASNAYLVPYRLEEVARSGPQTPGSWAVPDVGDAARLMRQVFENRCDARTRGERLGGYVRERFSEAVVIGRLLGTLEQGGVRAASAEPLPSALAAC